MDKNYNIQCLTCKNFGEAGCTYGSTYTCFYVGQCSYKGIRLSENVYSRWVPKDDSAIIGTPIGKSDEAYSELKRVLNLAYDQAANGKGKERHVKEGLDEAFEDQQICEIARRVGVGGPAYQAVKKIYESIDLPTKMGLKELLGAINYVVGMYIVMEEGLSEKLS